MEIKNPEDYKKHIREKIESLRPVFAKAAIGDFSSDVVMSGDDDEFAELYVGVQTIVEVVREKISTLEAEVGERQQLEDRLKIRTREQADSQKALLNVLEDLEKAKYGAEQGQAKYEALLSSIGDGIVAIDKAGVIIFMNEAAGRVLGFTPTEAMGQFMVDTIRMEDEKGKVLSKERRPISLVLASGHSMSLRHTETKYFYSGKGKNKFPVSFTISPVRIGKNIVGAVEVFRDVTKEILLDKAKSEFISVASHQLRTPVTAAKWLTELFRESMDKLSPREKQYLEDLSASVDRLSRLVEDLLNVSRIELGSLKMEKMNIDIVKFTEDFMKDLKPYADLKKHNLVLKKPKEGSFNVEIDSKILYNILQNLTSNGIDYSPAGTTVTIDIAKDESGVMVSISNQGNNIPKEEQERLFQKFYRGESTKKMKTEGTGLGLYIVKSNVESSGGSIGFRSEKGEDTVFWFTLPVKKIDYGQPNTNN